MMINVGSKFRRYGAEYVLAQTVKMGVSLVELEFGNRYRDPVQVENINDISGGELDEITGGETFFMLPAGNLTKGARFMNDGEEYILAQVSLKGLCLVSLIDGNRWRDEVKVNNTYHITDEEFSRMIGDNIFEPL